MLLIGESIHIISKKTKEAIEKRDIKYIQDLAVKQKEAGADYLDLNIGPARRQEGIMQWLINKVTDVVDLPLSLDTTNVAELESGLKQLNSQRDCMINSTSGDPERLNLMMNMAKKYNSEIIGLTMNNVSGIPKDPDGRLEIAMSIIEKATDLGIDTNKLYLDPLVLPVTVRQDQAIETLNSIRVFKESFDPPIKTIIGLSNISNGSPKELRDLINRIYLVLAMGCGLDAAIVNAFDTELQSFVKVIKSQKATNNKENLILKLYNMMRDFGELDDITYDFKDNEEISIYKTAQVLLNKTIYAHNYLSV